MTSLSAICLIYAALVETDWIFITDSQRVYTLNLGIVIRSKSYHIWEDTPCDWISDDMQQAKSLRPDYKNVKDGPIEALISDLGLFLFISLLLFELWFVGTFCFDVF